LKRAGFPAEEIANFIGETVEDINEILEHDEEAAHAALLRKMAILDYNNGIYVTKERGKKDGDWKRSIIIAINLKQAGFSAKEIAGFIGRTVEDVNKIFEEQGLT
ncbi:MAG: hypothetical protein LBQ01_02345, partial [Prevotellaceae bacterium]|nr:hypothetical protein [Prevotellaceae bacterium]